MNPLQFSQIRDFRNSVGGPLSELSLNDFSLLFNEVSGSNAFDQGTGTWAENAGKTYSAVVNDWIDTNMGGVKQGFGDFGAGLYDFFGQSEDAGRQAGEESLRGFVDMVPAIAGGALSFVPGLQAAGPVGLAMSAASSGANTLEQTDSLAQAALSAGLVAAGPKITEVGAKFALDRLRGFATKVPALTSLGLTGGVREVVNETLEDGVEVSLERLIAKTFGDRVVGAAGGETAMNLAGMTAPGVVEYFETGETTNPFTAENLLSNVIDPTILFGVNELIRPSVVSQHLLTTDRKVRSFTSAETEESIKQLSATTPTQGGKTYTEIERLRRDGLAKAAQIKDKDAREEARAVVEDLYDFTLRYHDILNEEQVGILFGRNVREATEAAKTAPLSEQVVNEKGETVEKPIMLQDVVKPQEGKTPYQAALEEVTGWTQGPAPQVVSDDAMLRLIRARENQEPATLEEAQQVVEDVNVVLEEVGEAPVDNVELQEKVEQAVALGAPLEEAVESATTAVVNQASQATKKATKEKGKIQSAVDEALASERELVRSSVEHQDMFDRGLEFARTSKASDPAEIIQTLRDTGQYPSGLDDLAIAQKNSMAAGVRFAVREATMRAEKEAEHKATLKRKQAEIGARKGGRKKADAGVLPEEAKANMEFLAEQRKLVKPKKKGETDEQRLPRVEFEMYDQASRDLGKIGNTRTNAQQYLANTFAKYLKGRLDGTLEWKGQKPATAAEYVAVLGAMLTQSRNGAGISANIWTRVKEADGKLNLTFDTKEAAEQAIGERMRESTETDVKYQPRQNSKTKKWYVEWAPLEGSDRNVGDILTWAEKGPDKTVDENIAIEVRNDFLRQTIESYKLAFPETNETTLAAVYAWADTVGEEAAVDILRKQIKDKVQERQKAAIAAKQKKKVVSVDNEELQTYGLEIVEEDLHADDYDEGRAYMVLEAPQQPSFKQIVDDAPGRFSESELQLLASMGADKYGSNVGETLRRIVDVGDEEQAAVAEHFLRMFEESGRHPEDYSNSLRTADGAAAVLHGIYITPSMISRGLDHHKNIETYFHEVGHILTVEKIKTSLDWFEDVNMESGKYLSELRRRADFLKPDDPVRQVVDLYFEAREFFQMPDKLAGATQTNRDLLSAMGDQYEIAYALTNVFEFLAMGKNSRAFADFMRKMPVKPERKSFKTRFVEAIVNLLGFNTIKARAQFDGTRLEELEYLFERIASRDNFEDLASMGNVIDGTHGNSFQGFTINIPNENFSRPLLPKREGEVLGYHGTDVDWKTYKFDAKRNTTAGDKAIYLTDSTEEAELAGSPDRSKSIVKPLYATYKNPMVIEAGGSTKDRIFGKIGYKKAIQMAKEKGHDAIIVKDIVDFGSKPQTTTILFDPKQIRSAVEETMNFAPDSFEAKIEQKLQEPLERVRVLSPKEMMTRTMEKMGMAPEAIERSHETLTNLFRILGADDFESGLLLHNRIPGAATISDQARSMLLNGRAFSELDPKEKLRALAFVSGHELSHLVEDLYNTGRLTRRQQAKFREFQTWIDKADVNERKLALEIMHENLPKEYRDVDFVKAALSVTSPIEVRANLMSMWAMSHIEKPDQLAMNLLPRPVVKAFDVLSDYARKLYGGMHGVLYIMPKFKQRSEIRGRIQQMVGFAETLRKSQAAAQEFYNEGRGLLEVGPEAWNTDAKLTFFNEGRPVKAQNLNVPDDKRGVARKLFDNWFLQFDQMAEMIPSFRPINTDMHNSIGHTKAMLNRTIGRMIGEVDASGKPQFESRESKLMYEKVAKNPKLNRIWSDWTRLMQEGKSEDGTRGRALELPELQTADPALYREVMSLSASDRMAVDTMRKRAVGAMRHFSGEVLKVVEETNSALIQSYIANRRPDLWKDAPGLGRMVYDAVKGFATTNDPATYQLAQQAMSQVASILSVDEMRRVVALADQGLKNYNRLSTEFINNPHFLSEIRVGKHFLHYKAPDGRTGGEAYDDLNEVRERVRVLRNQGYSELQVEETRRGQPRVNNDKFLALISEHDERNKLAIQDLDLSDEAKQNLMSMFAYRAEFERSFAANKLVDTGSRRKLKPGRETLDMLQTQIAYFHAASRSLNHRLINHRLSYHYANPEFKNDRVMAHVPQLKQMVKNYFEPDTEIGTSIATLNAGYFLGMNMSSMLIEGAQPFFSYVPEMQSRGMGYVESMRLVNQAQRAVADFSTRHIPSVAKRSIGIWSGRDNNAFWKNPEYEQLMNFAAEQDWISLTHASDVIESDTSANASLYGVVGRGGKKRAHALSRFGITPAMTFARMGLKVYQQSTEFNARVALITGYEMAKKKGLSRQAAWEEAGRFARVVSFSGGKLNRPNAMFSGSGPVARTVGQALYSLQGYTYGMLSMMRRYAETGYSQKQYPGLSHEDRKNARKALKTMIITQFAGAGALGMPFIGAGMKALEALTGVVVEDELQDELQKMFREDQDEDGGLLTNAVLHGAANAIAGKVLPGAPDVSSRFAIGGVMGVNSYDGYSLSNLVGPTGAVIENVAKGTVAAAQGQVGETFESIAPPAWKRIISLMRDDFAFRDNGGGLLVDGTFGEKFAHSIGFTPQRIAHFKSDERLQRRQEEALRKRDIRFHDELSKMVESDPSKVQNELYKAALESPKVQMALQMGDQEGAQRELMTAMKAGATKIAERLERAQFARDPRREGTLNGTYGRQFSPSMATETQRLAHRASTMQQIGVDPGLTSRMVNRAQLIDQIMNQYSIGRAEAGAMADRLLAQR